MALWNFEIAGTLYELVEHTKRQCVTDNVGLQHSIDKSLECLSSSAKLYILQRNDSIVTAIVGDISRTLAGNDEYVFVAINDYNVYSITDKMMVTHALEFLKNLWR